MQGGVISSGRDPIDGAASGRAIWIATVARRAVQETIRGKQELAIRIGTLVAGEMMQRRESAGCGIDRENGAAIELARRKRRAIQASIGTERQRRLRIGAVAAIKAMQNGCLRGMRNGCKPNGRHKREHCRANSLSHLTSPHWLLILNTTPSRGSPPASVVP